MTLQQVRMAISNCLKEAGIEAYDYESWALIEWKLGISRADFYMDPGREISDGDWSSLEELLEQRARRVPLQYLMHSCEFMGYDFYVDERVLIPRQDTECLVEEAVNFMKERIAVWNAACYVANLRKTDAPSPLRILDLCTGSGCIGISLKLLCPEAEVVLADLSPDALEVATKNSRSLGANVTLVQGDLFDALSGLPEEKRKFDLIISNPPYIPTEVVGGLMPEVRDHEPLMALDGTEDGLAFYRRITEEAGCYLKAGGGLYYEIGAEQGHDVSGFMEAQGFHEVCVVQDLAGLDRIVKGRLL